MELVEFFVQEKLALDEKRWNDILISTGDTKLSKKDIFNYYSHPKIRKAMLDEMKGRDTIVRQTFHENSHVLKRHELGRRIRIDRDKRNVSDPRDFSYFIERRATEFHPTFGKKEKRLVVDLDPAEGYPFEDAKKVTGQVRDLVGALPGIRSTEVRFSGGRGFYVIGHLAGAIDVNRGRELLRKTLEPMVAADARLTLGAPKGSQLRLDLTPFKVEGSVRGLLSLNAATGLVSIPVVDLDSFNPSQDATIEAVLGAKPKDAPHAR